MYTFVFIFLIPSSYFLAKIHAAEFLTVRNPAARVCQFIRGTNVMPSALS